MANQQSPAKARLAAAQPGQDIERHRQSTVLSSHIQAMQHQQWYSLGLGHPETAASMHAAHIVSSRCDTGITIPV
jgi:hypothetical protein